MYKWPVLGYGFDNCTYRNHNGGFLLGFCPGLGGIGGGLAAWVGAASALLVGGVPGYGGGGGCVGVAGKNIPPHVAS